MQRPKLDLTKNLKPNPGRWTAFLSPPSKILDDLAPWRTLAQCTKFKTPLQDFPKRDAHNNPRQYFCRVDGMSVLSKATATTEQQQQEIKDQQTRAQKWSSKIWNEQLKLGVLCSYLCWFTPGVSPQVGYVGMEWSSKIQNPVGKTFLGGLAFLQLREKRGSRFVFWIQSLKNRWGKPIKRDVGANVIFAWLPTNQGTPEER